MVRGIDRFREQFRDHAAQFALIGGVAADAWFTRSGLTFRATKDIDVVLIVEVLDDAFLRRIWEFVRSGRYERRERSSGRRTYYRFTKPADPAYPETLELFSRAPEGLVIPPDQTIVPIPAEEDASSLSAILMDDDYYGLVVANRAMIDALPCVTPACLVLLKACAWGDLSDRRARGDAIDERHVRKHRNDVFRLALLLAADERVAVPARVHAHLQRLLDEYPAGAPEWASIEQSLQLGAAWPGATAVVAVLRDYFTPV